MRSWYGSIDRHCNLFREIVEAGLAILVLEEKVQLLQIKVKSKINAFLKRPSYFSNDASLRFVFQIRRGMYACY